MRIAKNNENSDKVSNIRSVLYRVIREIHEGFGLKIWRNESEYAEVGK